MSRLHPASLARLRRLACAVAVLSVLLGLAPGGYAPVYATPNACPAAPASLPDVIERTNFCVYYNDANTPVADATTVADHTQAYWDRYVTDFGFQAPLFSSKLEVRLIDDAGCNGSTGSGDNFMTVYDGCAGTPESLKKVTGHELFHRVQFSYDTDYAANWWMTEGTARTVEDNAFSDIDNWATTLTAVSSSFNKQVNQYLSNTNADVSSQPQRYNSALWWKYMEEQYGTTAGEPQLGIDAMRRLWEAAETLDDIAAVNSALGTLGAGVNFDGAFRRFVAANWIKDLTNQPAGGEYNYADEDQVGNGAPYGPIVPTSGGTISIGTPATFANQAITRYGARYYRTTPSAANCPVVSARFHTDAGPGFYHVITQKGNALDGFASGTATDFTRAFFNDGLTSVVAIAGSTDNSATVDVTLECVNPVLDIRLPNNAATAQVGPFNAPGKLLAQVLVTNGDPKGPVIAGLTTADFKAKVNGVNALITTGGFIQQQYWLQIQAPNQVADGTYDLEITLEKSGTATAIATDTNLASVVYNANNIDHVLVIDRSGSMSSDGKMVAAKQAAKFYVDITRLDDGLAVVPYNQNISPAPFGMTEVTAAPNVRQAAKDYIDHPLLTASGATSIGDGMAGAVTQRAASTTGNTACSFVLLSDGMENSAQFWADVQGSVQGTGCPVTSIAFGAASDETLMQAIATATGGPFFYNDVYVGGVAAASADAIDAVTDTYLGLGNSYEFAQAQAERRQRLLQRRGAVPVSPPSVQTHTVRIDDSVREALFALDWVPVRSLFPLSMTLVKPDGSLITQQSRNYDFIDFDSGHLGWRIPNPDPGVWQILVDFDRTPNPTAAAAPEAVISSLPYQVIVSGQSNLTANLLLPARLRSSYFTGNRVPLFALVSTGAGPIGGLMLNAIVTAPNGAASPVMLYDDGQHGDGQAGDGFYGGLYTLVNQANPVPPPPGPGEPTQEPAPKDEGSYQVRLDIATNDFQRETLGSFSVQEGADANGDGMPDPFEQENDVTGDGADPDLDDLDNKSEYQLGTDPRNSDSDGGGEHDGSEFSKGKNPLDPSDDEIAAPEFLRVFPNVNLNVLTYDVRPEYSRMVLYRATGPDGPWDVQEPELPATGVYSDTAANGTTYFYRFMGIDRDDNRSRVIDTTPGTPSTDPFPPEADIAIDGDAPTTADLAVVIDVVPVEHEEAVDLGDIAQMKVSNSPLLEGANWQPFSPTLPWTLAPTPAGEEAIVYAAFRDGAGNESLVVLDSILVVGDGAGQNRLFLPLLGR